MRLSGRCNEIRHYEVENMTTGPRNIDGYCKSVLTVIAIFLCWICVRDIPIVSRAMAQDRKAPGDVVEAREFRVVDEAGKVRAKLALNPAPKEKAYYEDKPGVYLFRSNGRSAAQFGVSDENGSLVIRDLMGNPAVGIGVSKSAPDIHQAGFVTVSDTRNDGATLGAWIDWEKGVGPASALKLFTGAKRKVF